MKIGVIGGDRRQAMLAERLAEDGFDVCTYGLGAWGSLEKTLAEAVGADVVILPLPLCWQRGVLNCLGEEIRTADLFALLRPEQLVLAGQVKPEQYKESELHGIYLRDYFLREELTVANAAATAEAALQVAMEQLDRTVLGMECLVLGFGRIGKLLSFRLHGLGGRVTATARKAEDLAWINAFGWRSVRTDEIGPELRKYAMVFNTIPALVLDEGLLEKMRPDSMVIDLASARGVDETAAAESGIKYIWARGLPGKLVPRTAAVAIYRTVCGMIEEWRE